MKTLLFFFMTLSVHVLAMPGTRSYHHDHYRNRNEVMNTIKVMSPPQGTALVSDNYKSILDNIKVEVNGTEICVYYLLVKLGCVDIHKACGIKVGPVTIGCADDEENYLGLCYKKCSLLASADFPLRTATNTCAKDGCDEDEENDAGLCYPKCKENYMGVATVCWGYCSYFCGPEYDDMGLYCYQWWPPKSCYKPRYDRGAGTLPYKPWTNGMGCNGFGVNNQGGCAKIDISGKVPIDLGCNKQ
ncbi:PREDICTED: uncharacterized protein LOC100636823 [Amphimedon queenslandica]|uniref:Uncharacterized protein n=1 Tax=Amphimedon queenslandica TaxID=400682 RepID=A0A1X7VA06_AMPQE|nr:PREDICTED: uncharacterized protein LOC100636823 [Amphimedon queenslandica]|eukprot:XP_003385161.1 PREDICTED: uncharacterized protein LOC100636823 [Amphimedon queenslandica]